MSKLDFAANRRQFLTALTAAASIPSLAFAKSQVAGAHPAVRALIDQYVGTKSVANMVVAVGGRHGAPDFLSAGQLELDAGPAAGPDSLYRIFSMTKPITGCAVMMLIEEGKLTLDTPLAKIFPGYAQMKVLTDPGSSLAAKPAVKQILIRHIVTHSAGLAYASTAPAPLAKLYQEKGIDAGRGSPEEEAKKPQSLIAFAEAAASLPLLFEPGSKWNYSIGLDIAGAVVEKVSGVPFDAFLAQRIFAPLAMPDTGFTVPRSKLERFAAVYDHTPTGLKLLETAHNSEFDRKPLFPSGGGGLISSARDYSQFMAMLLGEGQLGRTRILKTETARLMMSNLMEPGVPATTALGETGYGVGGRSVVTAIPGGEAAGTYGWSGAANSQAFVDRVSGVYTVLMTQIRHWPTNTILADLDRALYSDLNRA